eukprot:2773133-Heterocapsa_arctica.AAC.1
MPQTTRGGKQREPAQGRRLRTFWQRQSQSTRGRRLTTRSPQRSLTQQKKCWEQSPRPASS